MLVPYLKNSDCKKQLIERKYQSVRAVLKEEKRQIVRAVVIEGKRVHLQLRYQLV